MELLEKFAIDWRTLLAQIVNFLIVLAVLYKFAYKPILEMLKDRTDKIDKSLKDAAAIQQKMEDLEKEKSVLIRKAKKEAQKVLEQAQAQAETNNQQTLEQTKEKVQGMIDKARREIQEARHSLVAEVRSDVVDIVALSLTKILAEKIDAGTDKKFIDQVLHDVYQQQKKSS